MSFKFKEQVSCLKFSPNSEFVAAGCFRGEITIPSIPNLVKLHTINTNLSRIACLSFSKNNEMIGFSDERTIIKVLLIKTKKVAYENEEKSVVSVCFCSNDKKFFYSDMSMIYLLAKNFSLMIKIHFNFIVTRIYVNEDNRFVLVCHDKIKWSLIKAKTLEKEFEDKNLKYVKKWCTRKQDKVFQTHLSLSNRIFN